MTGAGALSGATFHYRFSAPGGEEIETRDLSSDDAADDHARDLSRARSVPVVVHRLHGHVDWEYLTEADERP